MEPDVSQQHTSSASVLFCPHAPLKSTLVSTFVHDLTHKLALKKVMRTLLNAPPDVPVLIVSAGSVELVVVEVVKAVVSEL